MRGMQQRWGSYGNVIDPIKETPGSLIEAVLLFVYLIVWSLVAAAYIAVFILTGVVSLLLLLVWLPCLLWSKVAPKARPRGAGPGPRATPAR